MMVEADNMGKLRIKPIKHPYRNLWYHFRFKPSGIPELDAHFNKVFNKGIQIYKGGHLELFDQDLELVKIDVPNLTEGVRMALKSKEKVSAHTKVQKYLLSHDIFSVATEVPVSSAAYEVSGFIDLIRCNYTLPNDIIQILDYKPPGTEKGVEGQLERYRQLLQMNTGTLRKIIVGYFNEKGVWMEQV